MNNLQVTIIARKENIYKIFLEKTVSFFKLDLYTNFILIGGKK